MKFGITKNLRFLVKNQKTKNIQQIIQLKNFNNATNSIANDLYITSVTEIGKVIFRMSRKNLSPSNGKTNKI